MATATEKKAPRRKHATGAAAADGTIKVRATQLGFYGDVRRRIGDVFQLYPRTGTFTVLDTDEETGKPLLNEDSLVKYRLTHEEDNVTISAEDQFNPKWMERVADDTPEKAISAQERIQAEHDLILKNRLSGGMPAEGTGPTATGQQSVLGDD